jgi:hypothetical protein
MQYTFQAGHAFLSTGRLAVFGQAGCALMFSRDANEQVAGDVFGRESRAHRLEFRTLVDYVQL